MVYNTLDHFNFLLIRLFLSTDKKIKIDYNIKMLNACRYNNLDEVKQLFNLEIANTCLYYAVEYNKIDIIEYALNNGANINCNFIDCSKIIINAVDVALLHNNIHLVDYLINKGAIINEKDQLIKACRDGFIDVVKYLVEKCKFNVNKRYNFMLSDSSYPLTEAILNGHFNIVKYLIEYGADITIKCKSANLLMLSCTCKLNIEIINYLLKIFDVNCKDEQGNTAIHYAVCANKLDILDHLVLNDGDVDSVNNNNQNILIMAQSLEAYKYMRYLGLDYIKDIDGITPLTQYIQSYDFDIATYIISKYPKEIVNDTCKNGYNALTYLLQCRLEDFENPETQEELWFNLFVYLYENTENKTTKSGYTPLMLAAKHYHLNAVKYILERVDIDEINKKNIRDNTALTEAMIGYKTDKKLSQFDKNMQQHKKEHIIDMLSQHAADTPLSSY